MTEEKATLQNCLESTIEHYPASEEEKAEMLKRIRSDGEETDRLLTVNEAAAFLRTTEQTLKRWIRDGKIKAVTFGRKYLISKEEISRRIAQ